MIKIEIMCDSTEYAFHLLALVRGLGDAPEISALEADLKTPVAAPDDPQPTTTVDSSSGKGAIIPATFTLGAVHEGPRPIAPEENPGRRRRRTNAEIAADKAAAEQPKPTISSGEECVNPQDIADEAAERTDPGKLTHYDVRRALKAYGDKFGHPSTIEDMELLIGGKIGDLPDDQAALQAAVDKLEAQIALGVRPGGKASAGPAAPEPAKEPETGSLFGNEPEPAPPAPPPGPLRATKEDCSTAAIRYALKYDPSANPPTSSLIMREDLKTLVSQVFEGRAKTSADIENLPGEKAVNYGKMLSALREAFVENPFKR